MAESIELVESVPRNPDRVAEMFRESLAKSRVIGKGLLANGLSCRHNPPGERHRGYLAKEDHEVRRASSDVKESAQIVPDRTSKKPVIHEVAELQIGRA